MAILAIKCVKRMVHSLFKGGLKGKLIHSNHWNNEKWIFKHEFIGNIWKMNEIPNLGNGRQNRKYFTHFWWTGCWIFSINRLILLPICQWFFVINFQFPFPICSIQWRPILPQLFPPISPNCFRPHFFVHHPPMAEAKCRGIWSRGPGIVGRMLAHSIFVGNPLSGSRGPQSRWWSRGGHFGSIFWPPPPRPPPSSLNLQNEWMNEWMHFYYFGWMDQSFLIDWPMPVVVLDWWRKHGFSMLGYRQWCSIRSLYPKMHSSSANLFCRLFIGCLFARILPPSSNSLAVVDEQIWPRKKKVAAIKKKIWCWFDIECLFEGFYII